MGITVLITVSMFSSTSMVFLECFFLRFFLLTESSFFEYGIRTSLSAIEEAEPYPGTEDSSIKPTTTECRTWMKSKSSSIEALF